MNDSGFGHRRDADRTPLGRQCKEHLNSEPVLRINLKVVFGLLLACFLDIFRSRAERRKRRSDAGIYPTIIVRRTRPPPRRVNQFFISAPELF
jgi:hypothetical protein